MTESIYTGPIAHLKQKDKIIASFEKLTFEEKARLFEEIKEYMKQQTEKALTEARLKVSEFEKLHESITQ